MSRGISSSGAYVMIAGMALVVAAASRPARQRSRSPLDTSPLDEEDPPDHVGQEGFRWPLRDRFRRPEDFQKALENLGYQVEVTADVLDDQTRSAISAFKLDWNMVTEHFDLGDQLDVTPLFDAPTVEAIASAGQAQRDERQDWFQFVDQAIRLSRPEVG